MFLEALPPYKHHASLKTRPSSTMIGLTVLTIVSLALAQSDSIVGTWSTKSNSTFTGPVRLSLPVCQHETMI